MDAQMIKQYTILADFLGKTLGPDYEISLYDLSDTNTALIAIANGHITGRPLGSPLPMILLHELADKSIESMDYRLNYSGTSIGNKTLRTSSLYIKDDKKEIIGVLSITFDDSRYQDITDRILKLCHPDAFIDTNFIVNTESFETKEPFLSENNNYRTTEETLNKILAEKGLQADRLTPVEKLEIIVTLEKAGVFQFKGAIKDVSERLACSTASIYRYLSKIRKAKQYND